MIAQVTAARHMLPETQGLAHYPSLQIGKSNSVLTHTGPTPQAPRLDAAHQTESIKRESAHGTV